MLSQEQKTMPTRPLGNSDLYITAIGYGAWAIGGEIGSLVGDIRKTRTRSACRYAPPQCSAIAAIHRALDLGMNWIDTAAVYGLGHSEEIVGKVLKERSRRSAGSGARSERPYVFTKLFDGLE